MGLRFGVLLRPKENCHGDVVIQLAGSKGQKIFSELPGSQDRSLNNEDYRSLRQLDDYADEHDNRGGFPEQPSDWEPLRGVGPPRRSEFLGAAKVVADGGGLCSPGRWSPEA